VEEASPVDERIISAHSFTRPVPIFEYDGLIKTRYTRAMLLARHDIIMTRREPLQPLCCLVGVSGCRPNQSFTVIWYTAAPSRVGTPNQTLKAANR
jgi:hypothetical protein